MHELGAGRGRRHDLSPYSAATTGVAPEIADTIIAATSWLGSRSVLSAGASWGAWLLWTIGLNGSFRAVSVHAINAHGEAQIFGWVGLFIMGFAYQAFPRDVADDAGRAKTGGRRLRADGRGTVGSHGWHHGGRGLDPGCTAGTGGAD